MGELVEPGPGDGDSAPDAGGDDDQRSKALSLLENGSDLAAAAVGAAVGLIGGPAGAFGGAASGVVVKRLLVRVGSELIERTLGPRQRVRVGAAYAIAVDDIARRLDHGQVLRMDWFPPGSPPSAGAEILEGILLAAADSFEERKVRHLGWLYAALAFEDDIEAEYASLLINIASALTYRQLVQLSLFSREDETRWQELIRLDVARSEGDVGSDYKVFADLDDLGQRQLVGLAQQSGPPANMMATYGGGSYEKAELAKVHLTAVGDDLYALMSLKDVPDEDIESLLSLLWDGKRPAV